MQDLWFQDIYVVTILTSKTPTQLYTEYGSITTLLIQYLKVKEALSSHLPLFPLTVLAMKAATSKLTRLMKLV